MSSDAEINVALALERIRKLEAEVSELKNETLAQMQNTLTELQRTMERIQNIAIGMGLYYLVDSFGLVDTLKALL